MTREDEAKAVLDAMGFPEAAKVKAGVGYGSAIAAMLAFADAEAAAMRERAAKLFRENIVDQSLRVGTVPEPGETPGRWRDRTRLAAIRALQTTEVTP